MKLIANHEHCLRIICSDKDSSFEELGVKERSVSMNSNNSHMLAIEMYKDTNDMSPALRN